MEPEGLKDYKVMGPLPLDGPNENPGIEAPQAALEPSDVATEDELFSSNPIGTEEEENEEEIDLEKEEDNEDDRTIYHELVGRDIRGHYETGWHVGKLEYYNKNLQKYLVQFGDGSTDYIKKEDIDGLQLILVSETRVSGRVRKNIDYKRLAEGQD